TILGQISIFMGLSSEELDAINELCEHREYKADEIVFTEKSKGKDIFIVTKGRVRIELGIKGKNDFATVQRINDGEIFGELAIVGDGNRSGTARCDTDCEIIAINGDALHNLFDKNNRIGYVVMMNLAALLASRLRKTNMQLVACFLWE
ncbi:Crp/Fnr family transcriptional regulator, partial [Chloroflexota bacterium]